MLHASLSTVIAAVITTNIYLILLALCLSSRRLLLDVGYKLLALFVIFTTLRLAFPFELLPFTITVRLPKFISPVISLCRVPLGIIGGLPISLWMLFLMVWAVGIIIGLIHYIYSYFKTRYLIILYGKELTHKAPYAELLARICNERKRRNRFRVIELPGLASPALFGAFSPWILIPEKFDLSERDLYYILRHETAHHFHHDLLLKILVKLITLVYWWDPFCHRLNNQTEIILEMRVDDILTLTDVQLTEEYMQSLIAAKHFAAQNMFLPCEFTMELLPQESSDVLKRFSMLQYNQLMPQHLLNILLIVVTLSIYLLSYAFIGEPFNLPKTLPLPMTEEQEDVLRPAESDFYFIDNEDGTYDFYYNSMYRLTTDSPEDYATGVPIYTRENCPQ